MKKEKLMEENAIVESALATVKREDGSSYYEHVKEVVSKRYIVGEDTHGLVHVTDVLHRAILINQKLKLGVDIKLIIAAALTHDICSDESRDEHHVLGSLWVTHNAKLLELSEDETKLVSNAVYNHRGSLKLNNHLKDDVELTTLDKLISAADRDVPDLKSLILRIWKCSLMPVFGERLLKEKVPSNFMVSVGGNEEYLTTLCLRLKDMGHTNEFIFTLSHLLFKYSRNGYAVRNEYYTAFHKEKLERFYVALDDAIPTIDLLVYVLMSSGYSNSAIMLTSESIKKCFEKGIVPNGVFNIIPSKNGFLVLKNIEAVIRDISPNTTHIVVREYLCNCGNDKPVNVCHKFERISVKTPIDDIIIPEFNRCPECGHILNWGNTRHNSRDRIDMIFMEDEG